MATVKNKSSKSTRALCICAVMLALSTALSFVKLWEFPWGGAVTLLSMLPVMLASIMCGPAYGFGTAFLYSALQLAFDIVKLMSWGLTPEMFMGSALLDYIIPFTALGVVSLFRSLGTAGKISGMMLSLVLRYVSHIISGIVLWHSAGMLWEGLNIENELLYSIVYNGCFMLPEIALTFIASLFIFKNNAFLKLIEKESI